MKYEHEETYRYLIASDLSWRTIDIVQGHALRWLVEVFIQDWKGHEGWAQLTKQPGEEGARQSVILSLLVDHSLFVHPDQQASLKTTCLPTRWGVYEPTCKWRVWSMSSMTWCRLRILRISSSASAKPYTTCLRLAVPKST
jgi:hypothetical protein